MSSDFPRHGRRHGDQDRSRRGRPYRDVGDPGHSDVGYGDPGHGDPGYGHPYPDDPDQGPPGPGYREQGHPSGDYQDGSQQGRDGRYAGYPEQAYAGTGYRHPEGTGYPHQGDIGYASVEDFSYLDEDESDDGEPGPGSRRSRPRSARQASRASRGKSGLNRRAFIGVAAGLGVAGAGAVALSRLWPTSSHYTFADDFNGPAGSAPDPAKWAYDLGDGGWGNDELEVYTSSRQNSFLDGHGNLVLRATKTVNGGQVTYRSARLKTLGTFSQYHGTFEARIKINPQDGLWPAWWMMGTDITKVGWPKCGEVNILENFGGAPDAVTSLHTPNATEAGSDARRASVPVDAAWHVWRMQWNAGGFTFFKDGTPYQHVSPGDMRNWVFSSGVPMFMLLNLAIGGIAGTPPSSAHFPVNMLVDYVRVW